MNKYFNIYGLIFVIIILFPNIIFAYFCKDGFENHYGTDRTIWMFYQHVSRNSIFE